MRKILALLIIMCTASAAAQDVPRVDPADPHRLLLGNEQLFLTGYYPGIQALIVHPQIQNFNDPASSSYYVDLIDTLADRNVNLLRVVLTMGMAYENRPWLHPYQRSNTCCTYDPNGSGNKFDVSQFNPKFFEYWDAVIAHAATRDVIVQAAIFDGFHTRIWEENFGSAHTPLEYRGRRYDYFRFENNINGHALPNLAAFYGGEAGIKNRQIAFAQEVVKELGGHWNLIWEVANEAAVSTPVPGVATAHPWLVDMRNEIQSTETLWNHPSHMIMPFDSPDHRDLSGHFTPDGSSSQVDPVEYTNVHQGLVGEFDLFQLPLIADNDCCAAPGTPEQLRKKAWTSVVSGAYPSMLVYNVAGSPNPLGLNHSTITQGMSYVGYTKKLIDEQDIDLVGMVPRDDLVTSSDRVWCLAREDEEYLVYFFDGGSATLAGLPVAFQSIWFDPRTGVSVPGPTSGATFIAPPGGDQVLYIRGFQEVSTTPVADAFVSETNDLTNFGSRTDLQVRAAPTDPGKFSFLEFNVPAFSGSVVSAKLKIRTQAAQSPGVAAYKMVGMSWSENSITYSTWDQAGAVTYVLQTITDALAANTWHEIDVTGAVTGSGTVTLGLASSFDQDSVFWSHESSYKPQLVIERSSSPFPLLVNASKDAFVLENQGSTNFGGNTDLRVRYNEIHSGRFSFLRFNVPSYQGTLQSATLRIRTMWTAIPEAAFYRMHDMGTWNESTLHWHNWDQQGTVSFELLEITGALAANTWVEIDVTAAVDGPGTLLNLGLASSADIANLKFWSRESGAYVPELVIGYQPEAQGDKPGPGSGSGR